MLILLFNKILYPDRDTKLMQKRLTCEWLFL